VSSGLTARLVRVAVALLVISVGGEARAQSAPPAKVEAQNPAKLKELIKRGGSACARRDWDEAVQDFTEASKLAPNDTRLREKLQRALDRRARAREATAAKPPPPPPGMSDREQDTGLVPIFKTLRWQAKLKREAFEARADAEAARPNPDTKKLSKLHQGAAGMKAEEVRLTAAIAEAQEKDAASRAEQEKAFDGVAGVGLGPPHTR